MDDSDLFGSTHSLAEKLEATVHRTDDRGSGDGVYFVEYPGGEHEIEPATPLNTLAFELDAIKDTVLTVQGTARTDIDVTATVDMQAGVATITVGGETLKGLSSDAYYDIAQTILTAFRDDEYWVGNDSGKWFVETDTVNALYNTYVEILETRVREDRIREFVDATRLERYVDIEDRGAVVEDTFLVTWDAENYLLEDMEQMQVSGNQVVEYDGEHQVIECRYETTTETVIEIRDHEYVFGEREQEFLLQLLILGYPKEFLNVGNFNARATGAIEKAKGISSVFGPLEDQARATEVTAFMDPTTGLVHRHGIDKHTLTATFNVSRWVIDELEYNEFDHAGCWCLHYREDEFRNADRDAFYDNPSEEEREERWRSIERTCQDAKIPPRIHRELDAMYGE